MPIRFPLLVFLAVSQLAGLPAALAQPVPVGPEFQVNTYTTAYQGHPAISMDGAGNFVVVWEGAGSAGSDNDPMISRSIQGQRFDAAGAPLGAEFQVNTYTTDLQRVAGVAADSAGNFVVVWQSQGSAGSDGSLYSIQGQRYDSGGTPLGPEFQVNTYTTDNQLDAAVGIDPVGNFVVVWESVGGLGSDPGFLGGYSIQAQRYDAAGTPLGSQFQVNTYTTSDQRDPAVAVDAAGNFVVVWDSNGSAGLDTSDGSIQGQRFDAAGTPLGAEFQVNSYTTFTQTVPVVAADAAGNFVVAWGCFPGQSPDTSYASIQAQRFDASGAPLGAEFQVNSYTTGDQFVNGATVDAAGNFVIVWASYGSAGSDVSSSSVHGQRYDAGGSPLGGEFQVNTYTSNQQTFPAVVADAAGDFFVTWESTNGPGTDDSDFAVLAQRFSANPVTTTSTSSTTATTLALPTSTTAPTSSTSTTSSSSTSTSSTVPIPPPPPTDLLPARIAIIKPSSLAKFVAKPVTGDTFASPSVNPISAGGSLRVFDTAAVAGDDSYPLPMGASWKGLGNPSGSKGYKYKGAGSSGDPCKVVLVKTNVIKAVCAGAGVTLTPPFTGDIGIVLSLGVTDRYCARLGGDIVKNDPTLTKRKNAPAPAVCP